MKYTLDITNNNFDKLDFTEAEIVDFCCYEELPNSLTFKVWGATLLLSPMWDHSFSEPFPRENDMYIAGYSTITINNLIGGDISISLYDTILDEYGRTQFAQNKEEAILEIKKHWPKKQSEEYKDYLWESVTTWPYGFCALNLLSNGIVSFEFEADDMVNIDDYIKDPIKYVAGV